MYIRFVTGIIDPCTGLESGVFQAGLSLWYSYDITQPWLDREIRRSLDWFNEHLDAPSRFSPRSRRRRGRYGICWFRPEAGRFLAEAHHLAWLVSEAGCPVRMVRSHHPGEIVWKDDHQIVAVPNRSGPVFV